MLKLRLALGLALVVGFLTLIIGVMNEARPLTVLYRMFISIGVFGLVGFGLAVWLERSLPQPEVVTAMLKGQHVDITSQQEDMPEAQNAEDTFEPFTSDSFEQIAQPKE